MPKAAHCSECGAYVWLSAEGACPEGHPRSCLRDVREVESLPRAGSAGAPSAAAPPAWTLPAAGAAAPPRQQVAAPQQVTPTQVAGAPQPVAPPVPAAAASEPVPEWAIPAGPPVAPAASAGGGPIDPQRELLMAGIMPRDLRVNPGTTDLLWPRVGAYLIDATVLSVIQGIIGGMVGAAMAAAAAPMAASFTPPPPGTTLDPAQAQLQAQAQVEAASSVLGNIARMNCGLQILALAIFLAYFVLFEAFYGWTPGKKILGLKVISADGEPITLSQALSRNVAFFADLLFGGLVAVYNIKNSRLHQRVGDKWAGTVVIRG